MGGQSSDVSPNNAKYAADSSADVTISYAPPKVLYYEGAAARNALARGGEALTIHGKNFGGRAAWAPSHVRRL